ncbi:28S ribosomal protein S18c, mitochondrial [Syngnathoides biaculeatus]|uniref:28S ribosomal protein S18c, mitochondrial n=1 Tax=Syngnathoides biaculeatus TaxID=300417 RepID=UPI002ADDDB85|nr:28S ribosomal protein S18c, mitochondrial [Syngnathoides biaculeatus]
MLPRNRAPRLFFCVFSRLKNGIHPAASLSDSASCDGPTEKQQHKDDGSLVKMENPYKEPRKGCVLCNVTVDFKNIQLLSQFISPHTGRIYGRHVTGLCGAKQNDVSKAIKKAHAMGFMSVTHKHPDLMRDPNICGIKNVN